MVLMSVMVLPGGNHFSDGGRFLGLTRRPCLKGTKLWRPCLALQRHAPRRVIIVLVSFAS